jgi:hypothetical protein
MHYYSELVHTEEFSIFVELLLATFVVIIFRTSSFFTFFPKLRAEWPLADGYLPLFTFFSHKNIEDSLLGCVMCLIEGWV